MLVWNYLGVLDWMIENVNKHGKVFRVWFGRDLQIFFADPEDVKVGI